MKTAKYLSILFLLFSAGFAAEAKSTNLNAPAASHSVGFAADYFQPRLPPPPPRPRFLPGPPPRPAFFGRGHHSRPVYRHRVRRVRRYRHY